MRNLFLFLLFSSLLSAQDLRSTESNQLLRLNQRLSSNGATETRDLFFKIQPSSFLKNDLKISIANKNRLNPSENSLLEFAFIKNCYDLKGSFISYYATVSDPSSILNDTLPNFFYYESGSDYNFFLNGIFETDMTMDLSTKDLAEFVKTGIILGGSVGNFNYYLYATNGSVSGNKQNYEGFSSFRQNFKFNEKAESSFFDETHGFISYATANLEIKLGRDFTNLGYSSNFPLLDNSGIPIDQFSILLRTDNFNYSGIHANLLDNITVIPDSITGAVNSSVEKHIAYHRFSLRLFSRLILGMGEFAIYSDRGLDLSYLNPFSFYKSIEHSNRDRDNSILFFDALYNSGYGIQPYGVLLIDDIDFSKIGTGWWGNQTLYNIGVWVFTTSWDLPIELNADWLHAEPYVFTHRLQRNNFTNNGESLAEKIQPNSENLAFSGVVYFSPRMSASFSYRHSNHWGNTYDNFGNLLLNSGGDIKQGRRLSDAEYIRFGEGESERIEELRARLDWEFMLNFRMSFGIDYEIRKSKNYINEDFFNYIKILVKF